MRRVVLRELAAERRPVSDAAWDDALHLLGVLRTGQTLAAVERRELAGQVAGLYVPRGARLYVLGSGGSAPRSVIAHEVVHALQDEHFRLTRGPFAPRPVDHDGELATQALVEGDATEVQSRYVATLSPGDLVGELGRTLGAMPQGAPPAGIAPFLERQLLFPYTAGEGFVRALRARGGQPLLDRAFRHPPRTTAAVLDPDALSGGRSATARGAPAGRALPPGDVLRSRGHRRADGWRGPREGLAGRAHGRGRAGPGPARPDAAGGSARRRAPARAAPHRCSRRARPARVRAYRAQEPFSTGRFLPIGTAVEPSPGRGEAESAAERRLHAVVDTLGLHVYSGETYPDDRFVTKVALTPSRSLLGLARESPRSDEQWLAAIHPDDRARYDELFCYANERLLHPLELEYRLCGYDGVERWVWERIFPHRLRDDGIVDLDGVVADVTALHEATNERNDLSLRLERVLGGVAEFVVSCELRRRPQHLGPSRPGDRAHARRAAARGLPTGRRSGTSACTPTTARPSTRTSSASPGASRPTPPTACAGSTASSAGCGRGRGPIRIRIPSPTTP